MSDIEFVNYDFFTNTISSISTNEDSCKKISVGVIDRSDGVFSLTENTINLALTKGIYKNIDRILFRYPIQIFITPSYNTDGTLNTSIPNNMIETINMIEKCIIELKSLGCSYIALGGISTYMSVLIRGTWLDQNGDLIHKFFDNLQERHGDVIFCLSNLGTNISRELGLTNVWKCNDPSDYPEASNIRRKNLEKYVGEDRNILYIFQNNDTVSEISLNNYKKAAAISPSFNFSQVGVDFIDNSFTSESLITAFNAVNILPDNSLVIISVNGTTSIQDDFTSKFSWLGIKKSLTILGDNYGPSTITCPIDIKRGFTTGRSLYNSPLSVKELGFNNMIKDIDPKGYEFCVEIIALFDNMSCKKIFKGFDGTKKFDYLNGRINTFIFEIYIPKNTLTNKLIGKPQVNPEWAGINNTNVPYPI